MIVAPRSIVILDFGGQYAHLIASRIRRFGYFSEIRSCDSDPATFVGAAGIILSGGPQSVYEKGSPQAHPGVLELGIPVLGLCYGHQWVAQTLGGTVGPAKTKEYGPVALSFSDNTHPLFAGLPEQFTVWMSHGDEVTSLPAGFVTIASTEACRFAAIANEERRIFGIQFHIEVSHTQYGIDILKRFCDLCSPAPWSMTGYKDRIAAQIKQEVGDRKVFMLVSGGVDSTVAFTLLNEVLGVDRVQGLLIDTGLMRKNEVAMIRTAMDNVGITNLRIEDASTEFFAALQHVYEPEDKRKIIGDTFLAVQKRVSASMGLRGEDGWMLGQGTIYPDTIETGGTTHADHIKTHHNRVDAIQKMMEKGLVIEPLKELYKDEVRLLGQELGLPAALVERHPFPGPGLGVRILCAEAPDTDLHYADDQAKKMTTEYLAAHAAKVLPVRSVGVQGDGRTYRHAIALFSGTSIQDNQAARTMASTVPNMFRMFNRVLLCTSHSTPVDFVFTPGFLTPQRANTLREADVIVHAVLLEQSLYAKIWQFPVVLLPFGTKAGGQSIVLRPISSTDAMTAQAYYLDDASLESMTRQILAIPGIDMVFLDLTNKPPATIEWE